VNALFLPKGGSRGWAATEKWSDAYISQRVGDTKVNVERSKNLRYQSSHSLYLYTSL